MATIHCTNEAQFTAALTAAVAGDTITLAAGTTYTGNFVLPNKGTLSSYITITSNTAASNLPAEGVRISDAQDAFLPILRNTQSVPIQYTPVISCAEGANHYKLIGLKFTSTVQGLGYMLAIGKGDSSQQFESQEPADIIVDRCRFHASEVVGQQIAIDIHAKRIEVINSHFSNFWTSGQDGQIIRVINGRGPITIRNNHFEGGTEPILIGGADPAEWTNAQVSASPAPTVSGARLTAFRSGHTLATAAVGQHFAVLVSGGTDRQHSFFTGINTSTGDVTWDPPLTIVPDSGASSDIRWGAIPSDIVVERNYFTSNLALRDGIIAAPANPNAVAQAGTGTLGAGTHRYTIQAVILVGYNGATHYSAQSVEATAVLGATGQVNLTWDAVPFAQQYRINGRGTTKDRYWTSATNSFTDSGTAGTLASPPSASKAIIKNKFELKGGIRVTFRYNIVEYLWIGDTGYFLWIKSVNQDGGSEFMKTKDVLVEYNIFRHGMGWILVSGQETYTGAAGKPGRVEGLTVRHNLVHDDKTTWVDAGNPNAHGIYMTGYGATGRVKDIDIQHNTFPHYTNALLYFLDATTPALGTNKIRNNLMRKADYGVFGAGSEGTGTLAAYNIGEFIGNVVQGASAGSYPANNSFPDDSTFQSGFVDYDDGIDGDYHLTPTSPWRTSGFAVDGSTTYSGADIDTLLTLTAQTESGGEFVSPGPSDPVVYFTMRWARPSAVTVSEESMSHTIAGVVGSFGFSGYAPTVVIAAGSATDVTWGSLNLASASGNDITKTGTDPTTPNGSGLSNETLPGDGFFEFTAPAVAKAQVGFGTDTGWEDWMIEHCLRLQADGIVEMRHGVNATYHGDTLYTAGDVFRLTRTGTTVTVTKNGVAMTPSPAWPSSTGTKQLDVAIWTPGASITDAKKG